MDYNFALEIKYDGDDRSWYFYTDEIDEACQALSSRSVAWYELWDVVDDEWAVWADEDGKTFYDYHSKHLLDEMIAGIPFEETVTRIFGEGWLP